MATTAGDEATVQLMLKRWQDAESGLDQAWREDYMVYLSFPDPKNPNKVTVGESAPSFIRNCPEPSLSYHFSWVAEPIQYHIIRLVVYDLLPAAVKLDLVLSVLS